MALLGGRDVKAAAAGAHVGERTLFRWLAEDPQFQKALREAEGRMIDEAGRRLLAGHDAALDTLEDVRDNAQKDSDRRLAALAWLDLLLRWKSLIDFEQRLENLEAVTYGNQSK